MSVFSRVCAAIVVSTAGLVTSAFAEPYQATSAPAAAAASTIAFESKMDEFTPLSTQYNGATFAGLYQQYGYGGVFPGITGGSAGNYRDGAASFAPGAINFTSAVSRATFNFVSNPGMTVFSSYLNNSIVESVSLTTGYDGLFTGFLNSKFDRITIDSSAAGNGVFTFDDLSFTAVQAAVPEPAAWLMMIVGMGAMGVTMRRRHAVRVSYAA